MMISVHLKSWAFYSIKLPQVPQRFLSLARWGNASGECEPGTDE